MGGGGARIQPSSPQLLSSSVQGRGGQITLPRGFAPRRREGTKNKRRVPRCQDAGRWLSRLGPPQPGWVRTGAAFGGRAALGRSALPALRAPNESRPGRAAGRAHHSRVRGFGLLLCREVQGICWHFSNRS